jgi:hypothetical protein
MSGISFIFKPTISESSADFNHRLALSRKPATIGE